MHLNIIYVLLTLSTEKCYLPLNIEEKVTIYIL